MHSRIRVNAIHVGWMDTPAEDMIQRHHGAGEDWLAAAAARPFGRLLKPAEIRAVAFLACEESGMMTGALRLRSIGAGRGNPPPPVAEWPRITGVNFA